MSQKKNFLKTFHVTLSDIVLHDIPTQCSFIHLKIKQVHKSQRTSSVKIDENHATWDDTISMDCKIPQSSIMKKRYMMRLSFRIENSAGNRFTRFGVAELDLSECFTTEKKEKKLFLKHCAFKSYVSFDIEFSGKGILCEDNSDDFSESSKISGSSKFGSTSTSDGNSYSESNEFGTMQNSESGQNNSKSIDTILAANVGMTKFQKFEKQVDDIIAQMINDAYT